MSHNIPITELQIHPLRSEAFPVEEVITDLHATLAKYLTSKLTTFFVAYMDYAVLVGRYVNGQFWYHHSQPLELKYLQRLRVFNQDEEVLIWRSGVMHTGRVRRDYALNSGKGDEAEAIDVDQVLVGTKAQVTDDPGYTEIVEERGTRLILPFPFQRFDFDRDKPRHRVCLRTRNYVGTLKETSQATYEDCRFVNFVDHTGTPLDEGGQQ